MRYTLLIAFLYLPGCGSSSGDAEVATLAQNLARSLIEGDEEGFADCFVRSGDETPDGGGVYTDDTGVEPGAAWDEKVQAWYADLHEKVSDQASFGGVLRSAEAATSGSYGVSNTFVLLKADDQKQVLWIGWNVRSQRGRIIQSTYKGQTPVKLLSWEEYEKRKD